MFKSISASYKGPHDPWISISQSSYDLLTDQFNIIRNLTRISTTVYFNTLSNYNNKYKRYHLKELLYITKHGYGDIQNLGTLLEVDKVDMEVCANFIYATHNKTTFEFVELFSHYFEIKTQIKTGPKVTKEEKEGMYFCFDTFENYIEDTNRYRPHTIGKVKEGIVVLFEEKGDRHICVKDKEYKVRLINKEGVNSSLQWELNDHQKRGSYVIFETTHSFIEEDGFLVFCVRNRTGVYMNENYKRSTVKDEHKTERENDKLLVKLIDFNTGTTLLDFYVESI